MQDPWSIVIMVLLAVLIGACLPVLVMTFSTLGSFRQMVRRLGPRIEAVLKEVQQTTSRINNATAGMDESAQRAKKLLDATGELGESVQRLNRSLKPAVALGSVVGPAVAVAVKSFLDRQCGPDDPASSEDRAHEPEKKPEAEPPTAQGGEG